MENIADYFDFIRGQEVAVRWLTQALNQGKLPHACLFSGPPGVGKKTTAAALIRAVFARPGFAPGDAEADLKVLALSGEEKSIGKNAISQDLIPWLGVKPYRQEKKIVLIAEAHVLTTEASNALLKILEEPPEYALILLVSDQEDLLPTIRSRCQLVRFLPLSPETAADILAAEGLEPGEARRRAVLARGNLHLARSLSAEELETVWTEALTIIRQFHRAERAAIFSTAQRLEKEIWLLPALTALLRDLCIAQATPDKPPLRLPEFKAQLEAVQIADGFFAAGQELQNLNRYRAGSVNKLMLNLQISRRMYLMLARS
jgi:DNA polymerase-3 subunit delta'